MNYNSLESHVNELIKKHRQLDEEIERMSQRHISAELRQLKTQKLWVGRFGVPFFCFTILNIKILS